MTQAARFSRFTSECLTLIKRNLLRYRRSPDAVAAIVIQPLVILVMFRYVLGGETRLPDYVEYLLPGILAIAVLNGSATIGIGLADDVAAGVIDRLRALPISRGALLSARAILDVQRNLIVLPVISGIGVLIGFHVAGSPGRVILAGALLVALGWAFVWLCMAIALWTRSVEATQGIAFLLVLVFTFASSGFAPPSTMPVWLQDIVRLNPVTHVDDSVRILTTSGAASVGHSILLSLLGIGVILAIMLPLALIRYARDNG
jgi:ABC transporter DrrB family efflux protein